MKGLAGCTAVVVLGCLLAGCSPGLTGTPGYLTPTPADSTTVAPPPTMTPTPQWTQEQQAAIDAVQRYLDVSTQILQNLSTADWNQMYTVADRELVSELFPTWSRWVQEGRHLVGTPSFIPERVGEGMMDGLGDRYNVHGCYVITGSTLVDVNGQPVGTQGAERTNALFIVLHAKDNSYFVLNENTEDTTC
jgi:hypothetical protein